MFQFTQEEIEEVKKYRELFPASVKVQVKKGEQGFIAEILDWSGAFTQADTFSELIFMVNDCIRTILEVPQKYATEMPNYMPPLKLAQQFNAFPQIVQNEPIQFLLNFNPVLDVCK
jgi:predicted RNase H-like HicB family nuclease